MNKVNDIKELPSTLKVSQEWKGRHQFHTCGKYTCMRVRGQQGPFFTFFAIFIGVLLHLIFVETYFTEKSYYLSTIALIVLWICSLKVMLQAWLSDPGILPRKQSTYHQKKSTGYRYGLIYCVLTLAQLLIDTY